MKFDEPLDLSKSAVLKCEIKTEPQYIDQTYFEPHENYSPHLNYAPVADAAPVAVAGLPSPALSSFPAPDYGQHLAMYDYISLLRRNSTRAVHFHPSSWYALGAWPVTLISPASSECHEAKCSHLWQPFNDRPAAPAPDQYFDITKEKSFDTTISPTSSPESASLSYSNHPQVTTDRSSSRSESPKLKTDRLVDLFQADDSVYDNPEYRRYEREAFRKMEERKGGKLLGSNPQMKRYVAGKENAAGDAYRSQREKNNIAAKQSRDKRKKKEILLAIKIAYLCIQRKKIRKLISSELLKAKNETTVKIISKVK